MVTAHKVPTDEETLGEGLGRIQGRLKQLSARVHAQAERSTHEFDALRAELESVLERMREAKQQVLEIHNSQERASKLQQLKECEQIMRIGPGGDIRSFLQRKKRAFILAVLLGEKVPLKAGYRQEALKIKQEYHSFRSKIAQLMLLLASVLVFAMWHAASAVSEDTDVQHGLFTALGATGVLRHSFSPIIMVSVQGFCAFMIYVYIAMASREGILLLNGSSIRPWWIWHHYISAFTCIIFLMMPVDSPAVQRYVEGWLHWSVAQAALMLAQNRYQQSRMYTRIALGKSSAMDVVGGESSGMAGQLLVLLPFLFGLQLWQVFMGLNMISQTGHAIINPEGWLEMERHDSDLRGLRGMCLVGVLMAFMGTMNFLHTFLTIDSKRKAAKHRSSR